MRARKQTHMRTQQAARPDAHRARVENRAVHVDKRVRPDRHVGAVVRVHRRLDPRLVRQQGVVFVSRGCLRGQWRGVALDADE